MGLSIASDTLNHDLLTTLLHDYGFFRRTPSIDKKLPEKLLTKSKGQYQHQQFV